MDEILDEFEALSDLIICLMSYIHLIVKIINIKKIAFGYKEHPMD